MSSLTYIRHFAWNFSGALGPFGVLLIFLNINKPSLLTFVFTIVAFLSYLDYRNLTMCKLVLRQAGKIRKFLIARVVETDLILEPAENYLYPSVIQKIPKAVFVKRVLIDGSSDKQQTWFQSFAFPLCILVAVPSVNQPPLARRFLALHEIGHGKVANLAFHARIKDRIIDVCAISLICGLIVDNIWISILIFILILSELGGVIDFASETEADYFATGEVLKNETRSDAVKTFHSIKFLYDMSQESAAKKGDTHTARVFKFRSDALSQAISNLENEGKPLPDFRFGYVLNAVLLLGFIQIFGFIVTGYFSQHITGSDICFALALLIIGRCLIYHQKILLWNEVNKLNFNLCVISKEKSDATALRDLYQRWDVAQVERMFSYRALIHNLFVNPNKRF